MCSVRDPRTFLRLDSVGAMDRDSKRFLASCASVTAPAETLFLCLYSWSLRTIISQVL